MRKFRLLMLIGVMILGFSSCSEHDSEIKNEFTNSPLKAADHKTIIEKNGLDFIAAMTELEDSPLPGAADTFYDLSDSLKIKNLRIQEFIKFIISTVKTDTLSFYDITKFFVFEGSVINIKDFYCNYIYDKKSKNWRQEETHEDGMNFIFPSDTNLSTNNCMISLIFKDIVAAYENNMLPREVLLTWTIDKKEMVNAKLDVSTFLIGAPLTVTANIKMLGVYELRHILEHKDRKLSIMTQLKKNNKQLLLLEFMSDPQYSKIPDTEFINSIKFARVNIVCMNIALLGAFDRAAIEVEAAKLPSTLSEAEWCTKYSDIFNANSHTFAYYYAEHQRIAYLQLYYNTTKKEEGVNLVFTDGTEADLENYFGEMSSIIENVVHKQFHIRKFR